MADVITKTRSNYFETNDPEGLRLLLGSVRTDGETLTVVERDGKFMFYSPAEILGTLTDRAKRQLQYDKDWADDNPDEAWNVDAFLSQLKAFIAPDDACIIKSVGYEAMRSLFADAYIVTSERIGYASFDDVLIQKTRSALGDPKWTTVSDG